MKYPKNFLFGSSTAAHQIEGGNFNSDWHQWEKVPGNIADGANSDVAADSWNLWRKDIQLLKKTSQNAYRFSIEWAKIEPQKGVFDYNAINHYREILLELRENNIKSMVTLFHFVLPKWISDIGGFMNKKTVDHFGSYCELMAKELGELVDFWVTINEPQTYALCGYVQGMWCPGKKNFFAGLKIGGILNKAHIIAYKKIRSVVTTPVGISENIAIFEPLYDNIVDRLFTRYINHLATFSFIAPISKYIDFLGINYYYKVNLQYKKPQFHFISKKKTDMGWSIHQEGLYDVIMKNLIWRKPIYITENGVADENDRHRAKFLKDAFYYVQKAIQKGADVRGYFHWTLMDNFEWAEGYNAKFGLFTIDRAPRASAYLYRDLINKYSC